MRRVDSNGQLQWSEEMKDLARRIMEADGIKPLGPGERRPRGYYMPHPFRLGKKPLPRPDATNDKR